VLAWVAGQAALGAVAASRGDALLGRGDPGARGQGPAQGGFYRGKGALRFLASRTLSLFSTFSTRPGAAIAGGFAGGVLWLAARRRRALLLTLPIALVAAEACSLARTVERGTT
jgi:hypothetical protein